MRLDASDVTVTPADDTVIVALQSCLGCSALEVRVQALEDYIATKEQAAEVLGMKSAGGARFPLEAARKLGSDGLREALGLLALAELDLRGQSGFDERTAIDVLVARLAALSRRHARGTTRGRAQRV